MESLPTLIVRLYAADQAPGVCSRGVRKAVGIGEVDCEAMRVVLFDWDM